jgi:hypothetical protein
MRKNPHCLSNAIWSVFALVVASAQVHAQDSADHLPPTDCLTTHAATEVQAALTERDATGIEGIIRSCKDAQLAILTLLEAVTKAGIADVNAGRYGDAARLYKTAAREGNSLAQSNLGYLYLNGYGVPQSDEDAVQWFQKSNSQGSAYGEANLARMYELGRGGLPQSKTEATRLYELAAAAGNSFAQERLKSIQTEDGRMVSQVARERSEARPLSIALGALDHEDGKDLEPQIERLSPVEETVLLMAAIRKDRLAAAELLIRRGVDVNQPDSAGMLPLLAAVSANSDGSGGNGRSGPPASPDFDFGNLLGSAEEHARFDLKMVELLLNSSANPNAQDQTGMTPLVASLLSGHSSIVEVLLQHGADPSLEDKANRTP